MFKLPRLFRPSSALCHRNRLPAPRRRRAFFEQLEDRRVLAAGNLALDGHSAVLPFEFPALGDTYSASAQQSDGKYVFAASNLGSGTPLVVVRLNADGTLDSGFGSSGRASINLGGTVTPSAIAFQSNGKILIGGTLGGSPSVVRLTAAGLLDTSFDTDGRITPSITVADIAVRSDDAIVIAGSQAPFFSVARYSAAGVIDTSFDGDGVQSIGGYGSSQSASSLVLLPGNQILVGGMATASSNEFVIVKLLANGNFDGSFAGTGSVIFGFGAGNDDILKKLIVQPTGEIIAAGTTTSGGNSQYALARLTSAGAFDNVFSGDGKATFDFESGTIDGTINAALMPNGHLALLGNKSSATSSTKVVLQVLTDGTLFTSYDTSGRADADLFDPELLLPSGANASATGTGTARGLFALADGGLVVGGQLNTFWNANGNTADGRETNGHGVALTKLLDKPATVVSTSPALINGSVSAGLSSLNIKFSEGIFGASTVSNYELRRAGVDGLVGSADDTIIPIGVLYNSPVNTAVLSFSALVEDGYRLTIKDSLTDAESGLLDGDASGEEGGDYVRDFVVGANVKAWGENYAGQLGDGTTTQRVNAVAVSGLTNVVDIVSGDVHNLALRSDGTVWAWGENNNGQLGDGTTTDRTSPVQVPGLTNVVAIAAGWYHSLALLADGTVRAWGGNGSGQLGDGTTTTRTSPVAVSGLTGVTAITAGGSHSLAIKNDGTVRAWGYNGHGQLGDGTNTQRTTPVTVSGLSGIIAVSCDSDSSAAVKNDGTVRTWGYNAYGQLGDGTTTNRTTPVTVTGLTDVTAIAVGIRHMVALKTDGTVRTWGYNDDGALGDGTTTNRTTPVTVAGLSDVTAIDAGFHTLALKSDGTVRAWGYNAQGQLGDGTTTNRSSPVVSTGLTSVASIKAGSRYSIALRLPLVSAYSATVSIANDGNGAEAAAPTNGKFKVTLSATSPTDTVVSYTVQVASTATPGVGANDYETLTGTVTIPANTLSAYIDVLVLDDAIVEANETVIVKLTGTDNANITVDGSADEATVTITDDDATTVSITATDDTATEAGETTGTFTVSLANGKVAPAGGIVVNYVVSGTATSVTDYASIGTSVTILEGANSATITVTPEDESLIEPTETVIVTLGSTDNPSVTVGSAADATINITDDDKLTIEFSQASGSAAETAGTGLPTFLVTGDIQTGHSVTINVVTGGTATSADYTAPTTTTVTAGTYSATPKVIAGLAVTPDTLIEPDETITLGTITGSAVSVGTQASTTYTILDDDKLTVEFSQATGSDTESSGGNRPTFLVTGDIQTGHSVTIDVVAGGTATSADYTAPTTTTVNAGNYSATAVAIASLAVTPDTLIEPSETIALGSITGSAVTVGTQASTTYTITDDDKLTVEFSQATGSAAESAGTGLPTFLVTGDIQTGHSVTINVVTGGTATSADYTAPTTTTVNADNYSATAVAIASLAVTPDTLIEPSETIALGSITGSAVTVGTQASTTYTIQDDDKLTVEFSQATGSAAESAGTGLPTFLVTGDIQTGHSVTINVVTGGTATSADYTAPTTTTVNAGNYSATAVAIASLAVTPDTLIEPSETIALGSITGSAVTVGTQASTTYTITDDDKLTVEFSQATGSDAESSGGNRPTFLVTGDIQTGHSVTIDVVAGGTATSADYTAPTTTTVNAGSYSATAVAIASLAITHDSLIEPDETLMLGTITGSAVTVGTQASTTYTILDDDKLTVEFSQATGSDAESSGGNRPTFLVTGDIQTGHSVTIDVVAGGTATSADYTAPTTTTVNAGSYSATAVAIASLAITHDSLIEPDETILLGTITGSAVTVGTQASTTYTILDDDKLTVEFNQATGSDAESSGGNRPTFLVTGDIQTGHSVTINVVAGGSATASDYTAPTTTTVNAGSYSATAVAIASLAITPDTLIEPDETITLGTITGSAVTVGTQASTTYTILDDDKLTVEFSQATGSAAETAGTGLPTFLVTGEIQAGHTVTINVLVTGGTAIAADFTSPTTTAVPAGSYTATPRTIASLAVTPDNLVESSESIDLGTITGSAITLGTQTSTTYTILDDDTASVSIAATSSASEPTLVGKFTVTQTNPSSTDTVLTYAVQVASTAIAGVDYETLSGTVTIPALATTAEIDVTAINDFFVEGTETVVVTLTGITSSDPEVTLTPTIANRTATLNVLDDDVIGVIPPAGTTQLLSDPASPGNNMLVIVGTSGNDTLIVEPSKNPSGLLVVKRSGKPTLYFSTNVSRIVMFGLAGNDTLRVDSKINIAAQLFGDAGNDALTSGGGFDTLDGGLGNDTLRGGGGNDLLRDLSGNNSLYGDAGDDSLTSGTGNDKLYGGDGNDVLTDLGGSNSLFGESGHDRITAGTGNDRLYGGSGDDFLTDQGGTNLLYGESGHDQLVAGAGNDKLYGGSGNDFLRAGGGHDYLNGDSDNDILLGEAGEDSLYGGSGRDVLIGGLGKDSLRGESGEDLLIADTTWFDTSDVALNLIRTEWTATNRDYATRTANLQTAAGPVLTGTDVKLTRTGTPTVFDEASSKDTLNGGSDRDWYFFQLGIDKLEDLQSGETTS